MFLVIFCFGRRPIFILSKKFPVELTFQFSKCFDNDVLRLEALVNIILIQKYK
jgi:hypothetical protein